MWTERISPVPEAGGRTGTEGDGCPTAQGHRAQQGLESALTGWNSTGTVTLSQDVGFCSWAANLIKGG